ncbi:hypothetical protein SLS53_006252 [Cytospora paraplurivora]|uniref:Uncharacterized protein n=1 Tax=Cytospora paraplurivora TaxID=2898453 RepID=A0AAN9YEW5_9PEZI
MADRGAPDPLAALSDPPAVSLRTIAITGILVDIYGLDDLPVNTTHVSVLWLHNPRLGSKERMAHIAQLAVGEYNKTRASGSTRGFIAAAFDQRNHGTREVHPLSNQAWRQNNPHHAQDMFGIISGAVVDTRLLIDALPGYVLLESCPSQPAFDQHLCLGVSLGGHSTWQTLFADPRVTAGVSIIGCPDFQFLMKDRARLSKLSTYEQDTEGAGFLGSKDFPPALVAQCAQFDPKGIVFGTGEVIEAPSETQQVQLRQILDKHVKGKKFLLTTGGDDKLVPWRCSEPFTDFFTNAAEGWYKDSGLIGALFDQDARVEGDE